MNKYFYQNQHQAHQQQKAQSEIRCKQLQEICQSFKISNNKTIHYKLKIKINLIKTVLSCQEFRYLIM